MIEEQPVPPSRLQPRAPRDLIAAAIAIGLARPGARVRVAKDEDKVRAPG